MIGKAQVHLLDAKKYPIHGTYFPGRRQEKFWLFLEGDLLFKI
jgi:hypothetical protein